MTYEFLEPGKINISLMMNKTEEFNLWIAFKSGDKNALSTLYSLYVHQLYSYGLKLSRDESIIKDCIQETFLNLIDKRQTLIITDRTHLYLFKSLRNKIKEEIRSKFNKNKIEESLLDELRNQTLSTEELIVCAEEEHFQKQTIEAAFKCLSNHQREVIFLKYSEDLSYYDISSILEIDIASVRTLIYRTLHKMKESILKKGVFFFLY